MSNWYCILQGREDYRWVQIYKTFVEAENKKEAIDKFHETLDYKDKISQRILSKNIETNSLLLHVYPVKEGHFTEAFLEERTCCICGRTYKLIDKFNEFGSYTTYECCSRECDALEYENRRNSFIQDGFYSSVPVIYKITNTETNKHYIGQTVRSFTLRWWEHIKSLGDDKFHREIKTSDITKWVFSVIEVLDKKTTKELLNERERYWIEYYNTKVDGYNSN